MRWLNVFFTLFFLFFALLQYNDPDPYIWVPIYIYAASLCWQASKGKYYGSLYIIGMIVYAIYAAYLFFDKNGVLAWVNDHAAENIVQTMKAEKPWIEETREFGGLLIVFSALLMNYIISRKSKASLMR